VQQTVASTNEGFIGMNSATNSVEAVLGKWSEGAGPLHRKLADAFRQAIEHGYLAVDQRLPSERDLAARLAVSRSTVVTAYDALRAEGLLESRQGSGTRIRGARSNGQITPPGIPLSPVYRSLLSANDELISLACAVFPAHPRVEEALHAVVADDAKLFATSGYNPAGLIELREGVADMLTRRGTRTTAEQILVTTGAQQAVNLAAQLFVRPGDDVIVESPSFAGTLDVFRVRGARLAAVPVDDDGVDVGLVSDLAAARQPSAVYVMPSFHNPTGALMSERRRRVLADLAANQRVPIIEDNALENSPLDDHRPLPLIASFAPEGAPVLSASSLSKAAWGGLRIGWLRGPAPLIARAGELKAMSDLGSPLLDQAIAARILPHIDELRADQHLALRRHLDLLCDLLADQLPEWQWSRPRGGPSLWVKLPSGNAAAFAQVALRYGVEVIPGEVMSPLADHRDHLRFPFTAEPPVLEETVRRLASAWQAYAPRDDVHDTVRTVVV
jgi:DNA-binding transcriptional MocR family regulator